ncbi:MAG TPA: serine/threonine-protein kinase [Gemmatimonadaceae bacterium]|nr:serine/threonine-protein kinase [Gemmatimonadaceae bacterium]
MTTPGSFDSDLVAAFGATYDLHRELVGGGMSRVFVATERALNRAVVIKVLPAELAAGVNRERFRREIQVAAQLQHPHIVPLHAAGAHGDILYYTMPFIEGESLKHALQSGERLSSRDALRILHDVVDALAYAHERGVIHRDIKPANVLRSGGHAVVTDFGVAKAISAALPAVGMTTSGMAIGTPAYMAPEQLAGDATADHRMDIYAVGLLAYELLTGEMPFVESSPQATMAAQLTRDPVPLARRRADVPESLSALVTKCLAKDPADRPQSARELAAALDDMAVSSGDYTPHARSLRTWPILAGSAIVALLAVGTFLTRRADVRPTAAGAATQARLPAAGAASTPALLPLTHADSLAIAEALKKRSRAQAPASNETPSVGRKADAATATRTPGVVSFVDSVARVAQVLAAERTSDEFKLPAPNPLSREAFAERAANLGTARSVLVAYQALPPARPDIDSLGRVVIRRLRAEFTAPAALGRYSTVESETSRPETWGDQRMADSAARATGAEVLVSLMATSRRDSSATWIIMARDVTANETYAFRSTQFRLSWDSVEANAGVLAVAARKLLDQMDRAPRRGATDPAHRAFEERAANLGPPRHIVVANHAPDQNPAVQEAGSVIMDVLRRALVSSKRFVPVSRDSTLAMLEKTRDLKMVLAALKADAAASIRGVVSPADSITWTVTVADPGAARPYEQRSVTSPRVPLSTPLASVARLVSQSLAALDQLDHAPRAMTRP